MQVGTRGMRGIPSLGDEVLRNMLICAQAFGVHAAGGGSRILRALLKEARSLLSLSVWVSGNLRLPR